MTADVRTISLRCDSPGCIKEFEFRGRYLTEREVRDPWAKRQGWVSDGKKDYCQVHASLIGASRY